MNHPRTWYVIADGGRARCRRDEDQKVELLPLACLVEQRRNFVREAPFGRPIQIVARLHRVVRGRVNVAGW